MMYRVSAAFLAVALLVTPAAAQEAESLQDRDLFKRAGNFLDNCDARRDASGERPEETYMTRLCLSFMDGLVAGYTAGALANGNERPYCLPRPVTLVELMDMMTTVMDRGIPPETPTTEVLHFLLTVNFPCEGAPGAPDAAAAAPPPPEVVEGVPDEAAGDAN
jgi:hypothetical protein